MAYLTAVAIARINAQVLLKEAQLTAANTAYTAALTNSEIQSYSLDSGEGKQFTQRRKPEEILKSIRALESDLDRLYRRLDGTGLVNMNLRRNQGVYR